MTRFKENGTRWKGSQLSFLDHITHPSESREDLYCLTLAQSEALIAVFDHYRYLSRWLDDDDDQPLAITLVDQFVNDTQRRLMMPCGSDNVVLLSQWTPDGHYQESTDGGETYHDAPARDPRNNVPLPPPFLPPDTVDETCTYADSIVNKLINDWINATGSTEDQATVIEGIISFLAGIFGAFGVVAAAITLGIAIVIVAFTVAAWKAAFVSDVWDRLRCNIAAHMGADGSFTQSDVDSIYSQIGVDETGIVKISLQGMIAAMGWQGLTAAARSGGGSPTASCDCEECDGCDTSDWVIQEDIGSYVYGTLNGSSDCNHLIVDQSTPGGDGNYYIKVFAPSNLVGCEVVNLTTSGSPSGLLVAWDLPGETQGTFAHSGAITDPLGQEIVAILVRTSTPQTMTLVT